jgi:two-component system chemotaxis response regulator CheB
VSGAGTIYLNISELAVSASPVTVSTVLGSCVSVFLFSSRRGVGGVTHYALAEAPPEAAREDGLRYGRIAIPALVDELRRRYGVGAGELVAKVVGGSATGAGSREALEIGAGNVRIARELLQSYGIRIVAESTGGATGRKASFHIPSGRVRIARLRGQERTADAPRQAQSAGIAPDTPRVEARREAGPRAPTRLKVLVVDDSPTIRQLLVRILGESDDLEVLPPAASAAEAARIVRQTRPDVITLDVHMPETTGVQWLEQLLPVTPIPVVMITSLQLQDGNEVFRALELGAVDYIQKPSLAELAEAAPVIREKVLAAATARIARPAPVGVARAAPARAGVDLEKIVLIGSSTGGTEALKRIMCRLPERIPPVLVVQHIPPGFSRAFAERLNDLCPFEVKEAVDGDAVEPSRVLIAPGGRQMRLERSAAGNLSVRVTDDPPVKRHKPSVDYLLRSAAAVKGRSFVGVILTGMGDDGADGLLRLREGGAHTLGQDEPSSVVYGMPKAAFERGAVIEVVALDRMAQAIMDAVSPRARRPAV